MLPYLKLSRQIEGSAGLLRGAILLAALGGWIPTGFGQEPLLLEQAVRIALDSNPAIEAAAAGVKEAEAGIRMARAGRLPRIGFSESYLRSNNPVFVFGSLLNQGEFGPSNFEIETLNNPDPLNNFQSLIRIEQTLFDAQKTKHAIRTAQLQREAGEEARRAGESDVTLGVVRTYFGVVLAAEALAVAEQSVETAEADLRRAESMLEAGLVTKADVLSVRVHLAAVEEQRIRAANNKAVAMAALNDALGLDLERQHVLGTPLTAPPKESRPLEDYVRLAANLRPDLRQAALEKDVARSRLRSAQSSLWPRVVAQGVFEVDRQRFYSRAGNNWLGGVSLQWDIWKGSENRARVAAAKHARERAEALEQRARSAAALEVRQAYYELQSATERVSVAESAAAEAQESHRIIQNRYANGLVNVTELIRSETALMEARFRRLSALYDLRVARAALERAAGNLTPSSEALQ